jgi:hypothetical protein
MNKNYIPKAFLFTLVIAAIFSLLSLTNFAKITFGFPLKPISVFSDILSPDSIQLNDLLINDSLSKSHRASAGGLVCFQNFTKVKFPLDRVMRRLLEAKAGRSRVRVAWFGDSFSDGDILVSDLRDTLQNLYGGNGVGFVPITSETAAFRQSVVHTYSGWNTASIITEPSSGRSGINGFSYKPDSGNYLRYSGTNHFRHTRLFNTFRLFYSSHHAVRSNILINRTDSRVLSLPASETPGMITINAANMRQVSARISDTGVMTCYGASLEDKTGIYIDNFAIKGNSGVGLMAIPARTLSKFDSLLHYDLIVLQFGLNVASAKTTDFTNYVRGMTHLVNKLKRAFPDTPILLLSVSDRSAREQGSFVTMPVIPYLIRAQQKIASDNNLLFWNLFEAMGGRNSMAKFVDAKPPLANKDYTHLNYAGGRKIGISLARSFIHEVNNYQERRKNSEGKKH